VLSRPFLVLALAMFSATLGIGMVTPILPVYARSLGASGTAVGLTFSSFALTQVFISPFSGRLADRYGRKPFLVGGLATYVVAALGWGLTSDVGSAIFFRAVTGVGSAFIFAMSHAYIGDLAPRGREGRYMGTFGIFDFLGFGAGPIVAGVIRDLTDLKTTFFAMGLLFVFSTGIVALLLPPRARPASGGAGEGERAVPFAPWRWILLNPYVQSLFTVRASLAFSMGASFSFIAVYLEEDLLATATMVGLLLAAQQITGGLLQPAIGAIADRAGRRQLVAIGVLMVAAGYSTIWATDRYTVILAGFVIGVGIGGALVNVSAAALQVDLGRRLGMATVMSMQSMAFATGVLLGSLGGGFIVELTDVATVFLVAGGALIAGAIFFLLRTAGRPAQPSAAMEPALDETASG